MKTKHLVILMLAIMVGMTVGMMAFANNPMFPDANVDYQRAAQKESDLYNSYVIAKQKRCEAEVELATAKLYDNMLGFRPLKEGENKFALIKKSEYMTCLGKPDSSVNFIATENGGIEEFLEINASTDVKGHADTFRKVGNVYGISPELLVCIAQADSSLGKYVKTSNNIGNVGNTDSGRTVTFATLEAGIEAMAQTLSNQYLGYYTMIGELSNGGRTIMGLDACGVNGAKCYATSFFNHNKNVKGCMSDILKQNIDEKYNFRTDTVVE